MKNIFITLQDLFDIKGSEIINPHLFESIKNVSTDSRQLKKHSLFVALKGEKFDGHKFISEAIRNGASSVIVERKRIAELPDLHCTVVLVPDSILALGELAKIWRKKLNAKIIGITGSSGKTTVKEMLASILSEKFKVNKTHLNNNNHIGVPLTILNTKSNDKILIAELGTNHFGEIKYTANILQPDLALITNIGNSHLLHLHSKKEVMKEKSELLKAAEASGGSSFINNDDDHLKKYSRKLSRVLTFGFNNQSDVKGRILGFNSEAKAEIVINGKGKRLQFVSPLSGVHNAYNLLAAVSIALSLHLTKKEIYNGVQKISAAPKRFNVTKFSNSILIDDSYNANPESVNYAIDTVKKINSGLKKILILGDMLELGDQAVNLHSALADQIIKINAVQVFLIGKLMQNLYSKLIEHNIDSVYFKSRSRMIKYLSNQNFKNSIVLVKGSRGMKMEEFVSVIKQGAAK